MTWWAHSENGNGDGTRQSLSVHLQSVARMAAGHGAAFGAAGPAKAAGLLHDLGKYAEQFQRRLDQPGRTPSKDHWSAGAMAALGFWKVSGAAVALAIEGHHIGLQDGFGAAVKVIGERLEATHHADPPKMTDPDVKRLLDRWQDEGPPPADINGTWRTAQRAAGMLDVRMLFSALVDADFLDTEAHFAGDAQQPYRPRSAEPAMEFHAACRLLCARRRGLATERRASGAVQAMRRALWRASLAAATEPTGLFTLTAPTGSGKTLAMLAFAIEHARQWNLRRIILVMPYLNIIEQTAAEYRNVFGPDPDSGPVILEDHSLAGADDGGAIHDAVGQAERLRRLLAENWGAPIILTTNVKCLESMHAHRPGRCRKLHRLARSVILFDEAQTLPPKLAQLTLATLSRLADPDGPYGSTVVFATATQPAFDHLDQHVRDLAPSGWRPREIVPVDESGPMFRQAAQRVRVTWRHDQVITLDELADELADRCERQWLCIVNLKRHAAGLAETLRQRAVPGLHHLSTSLCPAHREKVIKQVTAALDADKPIKPITPITLIATQCVEAGVDLDFPVVYRAMAPLESLAQAAGRCNRHGRRPQPGQVVIVDLRDEGRYQWPPGYGEALSTTRVFLNALVSEGCDLATTPVLSDPPLIRRYYQMLYDLGGRGQGQRDDEKQLYEAVLGGSFEEVDHLYRLIDTNSINIVVPYDPAVFDELNSARDDLPGNIEAIRRWIARARPHTVSPRRPPCDSPLWRFIEPIRFSRRHEPDDERASWFIALNDLEYDPLLGLVMPGDEPLVV